MHQQNKKVKKMYKNDEISRKFFLEQTETNIGTNTGTNVETNTETNMGTNIQIN
jgi:hypothetical protein